MSNTNELLTTTNLEYVKKSRSMIESISHAIIAQRNYQLHSWEIFKTVRDAGLTGVWIPEEFGGRGHGMFNLCLVVESLARHNLELCSIYATAELGALPLFIAGTEEQKEKWLPEIARGNKLITFSLAESSLAQHDKMSKPCATREGGIYRINGSEKCMSAEISADIYIVFSSSADDETEGSGNAILVEKGLEGFEVAYEKKVAGGHSLSAAELNFDNCIVPEDYMIGTREGMGALIAEKTLDTTRPISAAQILGAAQAVFDVYLEYVNASGRNELKLEAAELLTNLEAARQLVYTAVKMLDAGVEDISQISAMCKSFVSDAVVEIYAKFKEHSESNQTDHMQRLEQYISEATIEQICNDTVNIYKPFVASRLVK